MRPMARGLGLAAAILLAAVAIVLLGSGGREPAQAEPVGHAPGLHSLRSCNHLRTFLRHHRGAPSGIVGVGMPGVAGDGVAAPGEVAPTPAPAGSPTNVQEEGVDEPDIVKTAGDTILTVEGTTLRAVGTTGGAPVLSDSIELPAGPDNAPIAGYQLLAAGDRLLAIGQSYGYAIAYEGQTDIIAPNVDYPGESRTVLAEVDISDPSSLRLLRTETIDGSYVSARLTGSTVRLVSSSYPGAPVADQGHGRAILPRYRLHDQRTGKSSSGKLVRCAAVDRPSRFAGAGMLSVLTIDLARGLPAVDADTVLTDGQIVYASPSSLYIATERWSGDADPSGSEPTTEIHRFDTTDPEATEYVASGQVSGYMLSQWSMSEAGGVLRVASTTAPPFAQDGSQQGESQSFVTVLATDGDRLRAVGRVGDLGQGEQIYAVRFAGDLGYVVTFRQVDPLYVVDLSDPTDPRTVGELKIPGYSAYLHPVGPGLLLGVGRDVDPGGVPGGLQVSLFDVSNPTAPLRLDRESFGHGSTSEVEYDHHAFSWFEDAALAALPIDFYSDLAEGHALAGLRVTPGSADPLGRVARRETDAPVLRTLELGGRIYAIEAGAIGVFDPSTLAPLDSLRY
ncbi:MAG: hypothetical protein QOI10_1405 [Solirubrobacterales bacterium]|jgi:uncharacterized secreted protein with C-terminal beta-propeller domain|nr:hypothetical protein [Solirubrobacterales bacterium]